MEQEAKELADAISRFVNRHGSYRGLQELGEAMVNDHPTLQQAKMRMFVVYVQKLAALPYSDLRNEKSVTLARDLVHQWGDGPSLPII